MLIIGTGFAAKEYGSKSSLFKTSIAVIADYVVQIILGFTALALSNDTIVVIHLTNAFLLAVIATYMISSADSADKAAIIRSSVQTMK